MAEYLPANEVEISWHEIMASIDRTGKSPEEKKDLKGNIENVFAVKAHNHDATGLPGSYYIESTGEDPVEITELKTDKLMLTEIFFGS